MKTALLSSFVAALFSLNVTSITAPTFTPPTLACKMSNGQNRPYPCEFQIVTMNFLGKNDEVVGNITPKNTTVKLPKSKAVKMVTSSAGNSYFYNVSLHFARINPPSFSIKPIIKKGFYRVGTSTVTSPISPGEVTVVKMVNVSPKMPEWPSKLTNKVSFMLQLNYATGSGSGIVAPVQYVEIRNPITFTKFPNSIHRYNDRAEAWIAFITSVDMTK